MRSKARRGNNNAWGKLVIELDSIQSAVSNRSNAEHTAEDVHDILMAYSTKRFVDNVYHQAVEHCLLSGVMIPLVILSEKWALQLDTENLAAVAGESRLTRDGRNRLKKIQDLEDGIQILR